VTFFRLGILGPVHIPNFDARCRPFVFFSPPNWWVPHVFTFVYQCPKEYNFNSWARFCFCATPPLPWPIPRTVPFFFPSDTSELHLLGRFELFPHPLPRLNHGRFMITSISLRVWGTFRKPSPFPTRLPKDPSVFDFPHYEEIPPKFRHPLFPFRVAPFSGPFFAFGRVALGHGQSFYPPGLSYVPPGPFGVFFPVGSPFPWLIFRTLHQPSS